MSFICLDIMGDIQDYLRKREERSPEERSEYIPRKDRDNSPTYPFSGLPRLSNVVLQEILATLSFRISSSLYIPKATSVTSSLIRVRSFMMLLERPPVEIKNEGNGFSKGGLNRDWKNG